MEALAYLVPLAVFLALYAVLHARARRRDPGVRVQWGWLTAIVLCAAVAMLLGAVL